MQLYPAWFYGHEGFDVTTHSTFYAFSGVFIGEKSFRISNFDFELSYGINTLRDRMKYVRLMGRKLWWWFQENLLSQFSWCIFIGSSNSNTDENLKKASGKCRKMIGKWVRWNSGKVGQKKKNTLENFQWSSVMEAFVSALKKAHISFQKLVKYLSPVNF